MNERTRGMSRPPAVEALEGWKIACVAVQCYAICVLTLQTLCPSVLVGEDVGGPIRVHL